MWAQKDSKWCSKIKPNGTYSGLEIFSRIKSVENDVKPVEELVMSNRAGDEWLVDITEQNKTHFLLVIRNGSEVTTKVSNVIHRFMITRLTPQTTFEAFNCEVRHLNGIKFDVRCVTPKGAYDYEEKVTEIELLAKSTWILRRGAKTAREIDKVMIFDRHNRASHLAFTSSWKINKCDFPQQKRCGIPPFVTQMSDYLFSRVDGVVDISVSGRDMYLVLFNIENKPKYCFTEQGQQKGLSDECKSLTKMKNLFEDCFDEQKYTSTDSHTSTIPSKDDSMDPLIWIIVLLVVVGVILLIAIGVTYFYKNRQIEEPSTRGTIFWKRVVAKL